MLEMLMYFRLCGARIGPRFQGQGGEKLFSLYCDLIPRSPYWTVADFNERHGLGRLGIDPRRFVYFGVIEGTLTAT